jgi:diguanylate cyclase (GGDEF)-like protein
MTGSANGVRVIPAGASVPSAPALRSELLVALATVATVALTGCLTTAVVTDAPLPVVRLLVAAAVIATAQLAQVHLRIGSNGVSLTWGEAGVIAALCLVPAIWVPVAGAIGAAVAHLYQALAERSGQRARLGYSTAVVTLACAAAAAVAAVASRGTAPVPASFATPGAFAVLVVAALAYFCTAVALTATWVVTVEGLGFRLVLRRAIRAKRLMLVVNIVAGSAVALLIATDPLWMIVVPPAVWLLHLGYLHRLRVLDDRRTWGLFAEATRGLNQLDEQEVVAAALRGTARLFSPDQVEMMVLRPSGRRRRYVVRPTEIGARAVTAEPSLLVAGDDDPSPMAVGDHVVAHRLVVGDVPVGELRLRFRRRVTLTDREQHAFSAFADAVAAALHDAATHRQLRAMMARSAYEALHDPLTGLHNRTTMLAKGNAVLNSLDPRTPVALLLFDVDRFREVNNTLSHAAGDELLRVLARRLAVAAVDAELVGRVGGDAFAVFFAGSTTEDDAYSRYRAKMITTTLAFPAEISGMTLAVEACAGVVTTEAGAGDMTELLRRADVALHQSKLNGVKITRWDPATDATSTDRLTMLAELREALGVTGQISLVVQPVIELATGDAIGVEALVRWRHPRRGLLNPAEFIGIVEHSELVGAFTRYVIDKALQISSGWATQGLRLPIAVNLSARSLLDDQLPAMVASLLEAHQVPPSRLVLEITETAMISELAVIDEVVAGLREAGIQVSVDDFGTGFSSLKFLTRVPVDEVKIDRTFVAQMGHSPEAAAIVRTTVDLARELGLRVIAEGVETAEQRDALIALGASHAQGFLFYPAMAVEQATVVLQKLAQRPGVLQRPGVIPPIPHPRTGAA